MRELCSEGKSDGALDLGHRGCRFVLVVATRAADTDRPRRQRGIKLDAALLVEAHRGVALHGVGPWGEGGFVVVPGPGFIIIGTKDGGEAEPSEQQGQEAEMGERRHGKVGVGFHGLVEVE